MNFDQFHFAEPGWFWGAVIIPVIWWLYIKFYGIATDSKRLESFIDKHLLKHLIISTRDGEISIIRALILGSILWICLLAAMAGPRWDFREIKNIAQDKSLLIILDLSRSMDAPDVNPSRLLRARQEIEDLINLNKDIKIGLIGFAADAHIIAPITDDMNNIKHLLPLIGTDLVFVQGTRLISALKTADQMLASEPASNKGLLIISDGGFEEQGLDETARSLRAKGIIINTLGVGSEKGINFVDEKGAPLKRNGQVFISKLEKTKLQNLANIGGGQYFDSDYSDNNTIAIINSINNYSVMLNGEGVVIDNKQWREEFYFFLLPVMFVILLWFRKGFTTPFILALLLTTNTISIADAAQLNVADKLFLNKEQQAHKALEEIEDYNTAASLFDDHYKRGVANYKAGNYAEAEKNFRDNTRPEMANNALYNLGNSLVKQNKFQEAIDTYSQVLKNDPNHQKAKHNLQIAKAMICLVEDESKKKDDKKTPPKDGDKKFPDGGGGGGGGDDDDQEDEKDKDDKDKKSDDKDPGKDKDQGDNKPDNPDDNKNDQDKGDKDKDDQGEKGDKNDQDNKDNKNDKSNQNKDAKNSGEGDDSGQKIDVDQWLNKISDDHKNFLKNQFYIESQTNNTNPSLDPW